jgi:6-phosphofructokinase
MTAKNVFYAQSGGVTSVINATACGLIETARQHPDKFGKVLVGKNGIIGGLTEQLIDTSLESDADIAKLRYTPAGAFGSCRHKLPDPDQDIEPYKQLIDVFKAHDIGYFFYNGGGDSQDTTNKMAKVSKQLGYDLKCIGLPKTIDNDLPITDTCPGFGSVAKYVAVSIREAGLDVLSMAETSTKIFVMEVMGRHTGWIAAASGLAAESRGQAPHVILLPEIPFAKDKFLAKVKECNEQYGHCAIVVSEGVKDTDGNLLQKSSHSDSFGHAQLGGIAPVIANMVTDELGLKNHWAVCDYLQRAARHIASKSDVDQAYALGKAGIDFVMQGQNHVMLTIKRISSAPYQWVIDSVDLDEVANQEKFLPKEYISEDGFHITDACREYLLPLIQGEDYPKYKNGLPDYVQLQNQLVAKKL